MNAEEKQAAVQKGPLCLHFFYSIIFVKIKD